MLGLAFFTGLLGFGLSFALVPFLGARAFAGLAVLVAGVGEASSSSSTLTVWPLLALASARELETGLTGLR